MTATPNATALIAAVRHFLEAEAAPSLSGRQAFHAKVAANVLAIVEREMHAFITRTEHEAYAPLFGQDAPAQELRRMLGDRLRDGAFDETTPGLLEALERVTLAQLAVDNPKYSTYQRLTQK
jgi:hypothetical protein